MYPNDARAKHIIIIFWIMFGITVLDVILRISLFNFYSDWENGNIPPENEQSLAILQMVGMFLLDLGITILSAIFFIRWFRRAYANLGRIGFRTNYEEGWAAGAWFVPFVNLVRPYEIMKETWNETQLQLNKNQIVSTNLVGWWWGLFITKNIISNIAGKINYGKDDMTPADFVNENLATGIASLITIPAIWVAIQMIRQMSIFEEELAIQQQQNNFQSGDSENRNYY